MVYLEPIANLRARCQANKKVLTYCKTVALNDLPKIVSYRVQCKMPIYDQQMNGTCTANTVCNHVRNLGLQEDPSRLFVYFCTRAQEQPGQIVTDEGADLSDAVISVLGICDEVYMPYVCDKNGKLINFGKFPPSISAYQNGKLHLYPKFNNLTNNDLVNTIRTNLALGYLIDTAVLVYPSFQGEQAARTGVISMPNKEELKIRPESGHEVLCIGYDDKKEMFEFENSWGNWGDSGFIWIPYTYFRPNAKNKFGDNFCLQILTLPISMTDEKVPAISDQRVTLTNFFNKFVQNLSDQSIQTISEDVDTLYESLHKKHKTQ